VVFVFENPGNVGGRAAFASRAFRGLRGEQLIVTETGIENALTNVAAKFAGALSTAGPDGALPSIKCVL